MDSITQTVKFRLSALKFAKAYGVTKAAKYVLKPYQAALFPGEKEYITAKQSVLTGATTAVFTHLSTSIRLKIFNKNSLNGMNFQMNFPCVV